MILVMLCIDALLLGFVIFEFFGDGGGIGRVGNFLWAAGIIGLAVCLVFVLAGHVDIDLRVQRARMEREGIEERYEAACGGPLEAEVLKEIEKWNSDVYTYKYRLKSPVTSWFYSEDYAEALEYISTNRAVEE